MTIRVTIQKDKLLNLYWEIDALNDRTKDKNLQWKINRQNGPEYMHKVFKAALYDGLSVTMNFEDYQEMKLLIEEYK